MPLFEISGVTLEIPDDILSPDLIDQLSRGVFERQESRALAQFVKPHDVVMEIGAGIGFISIIAAGLVGGQNVIAVEANPQLLPTMAHNFAINHVSGITTLNYAVVADASTPLVKLYLNRAFWASTTLAGKNVGGNFVKVPAISLEAITDKWCPTVLVCDVEGSEKDYFKAPLPMSVRLIILEVHHNKYAPQVFSDIIERLAAIGFGFIINGTPDGVICFERIIEAKD